jgi:hypothetical protein
MSKMDFKELGYQHGSANVSEAVQRAVVVIDDIFHVVPGALPFVMDPSAVLLFSGMRAESPYHMFGDIINEKQVNRFEEVIARHSIYRFTETLSQESAYPGGEAFSLNNLNTLNALPEKYVCIRNFWEPLSTNPSFRCGFIGWTFALERALARSMESGELPVAWLNDWWAPHNLRFGMLLGYPGEAISSSLWAKSMGRQKRNNYC